MILRICVSSILFLLISSSFADNLAIGKKIDQMGIRDIFTETVVTSDDLPTEVYVLHFWSSWCHTCLKNHSSILSLAQKYPIVGVVIADEREQVAQSLSEFSNPYILILDDDTSKFAMDLQVPFTPYTLLIDGYGHILYEHVGPIEDVDLFLWQNS